MEAQTLIHFVQGDATAPIGDGPKVITHVCNDIGGWGRGFVLALSQRWTAPEASYRAWYRDRASNEFGLGAVQLVAVEPDLWVANIIGQRDIAPIEGEPPVRYWAIEAALGEIAEECQALGASVHMPRMGCGLAGGDWSTVQAIVERTLCARDIAVTVYDF